MSTFQRRVDIRPHVPRLQKILESIQDFGESCHIAKLESDEEKQGAMEYFSIFEPFNEILNIESKLGGGRRKVSRKREISQEI